MQVTWLHISDFHIRGGDPYDRDVVLKALVRSVADYRKKGRVPDLIFATGDIAHGGKPEEYKLATKLFDDLLNAAKLDKQKLFVIPGNHDVDRDRGVGLARTLSSEDEADKYFAPASPKPHLLQKMGAFLSWHDAYFKGIRKWPRKTSCGPVESVEVRGHKLGILPINSALFCQDDEDHNKLVVGRRALGDALERLKKLGAELNIALIHHPLDWLNDLERSNIKSSLHAEVDFILRGHLHETEVEQVASAFGQSLNCAAGAAYQTRKWPNRAMYATLNGQNVVAFPTRYEDKPKERWTVDPSLFQDEQGYERSFAIPRRTGPDTGTVQAPSAPVKPSSLPKFRSNVRSRGTLPLIGREDDLNEVLKFLGSPEKESVLVLHGQPGVGKSEVAREFARRIGSVIRAGPFFWMLPTERLRWNSPRSVRPT
jgi:UDP-2,3-diacylglucosamine pyrophosphatase LpxH